MNTSPVLRFIVVVALVIILILGAWGIIVVASRLPSLFSGFRNPFATAPRTTPALTATSTPTQVVEVTGPTQPVSSGTTFTLAWSHRNADASLRYGYALSYSCPQKTSSFSIQAPTPTGAYRSVACNTPFNYTGAQASTTLRAITTGSQNISAQIMVVAVNLANNTATASGATVITLAPKKSSAPAASAQGSGSYSPKVSKGYGTGGYASNPNGIADLAVQIISSNPGSVQFKISNVGTKVAQSGWMFTATLPLSGGYVFTSQPQQAVYPGGYIINTLTYGPSSYNNYNSGCSMYQPYPYQYGTNCNGYSYPSYNTNGGAIQIVVDPYSVVPDINRYNNTASTYSY